MPIHGRPFDKGNLYVHFTGGCAGWQSQGASLAVWVTNRGGHVRLSSASAQPPPSSPQALLAACCLAVPHPRLPAQTPACPLLPALSPACPESCVPAPACPDSCLPWLLPAVEFPDEVTPKQAAALKAAFGGPTPNGAAPMAEVRRGPAALPPRLRPPACLPAWPASTRSCCCRALLPMALTCLVAAPCLVWRLQVEEVRLLPVTDIEQEIKARREHERRTGEHPAACLPPCLPSCLSACLPCCRIRGTRHAPRHLPQHLLPRLCYLCCAVLLGRGHRPAEHGPACAVFLRPPSPLPPPAASTSRRRGNVRQRQ